MENPKSRVEQYYDSAAEDEWLRLERHKMEFVTTCRAFDEFIPPGSTVLDVGGGPGRYSIRLARAGHRVTLLDLSAANVALARRKADEAGARLDDFVQGNALDLSRFAPASFDTVLLMGPLYHLLDVSLRHQAVAEAIRVLKPGGVLFAAFITRYATLYDIIKHDPADVTTLGGIWAGVLSAGIDIPTDQRADWRDETAHDAGFTDAHFAHPLEIEPFMSQHNLTKVRLAAAEGMIAAAEPAINSLPDAIFDRWADLCYRLGTDETVWGAAEHMLYVGRKA